MTAEQKYQLAMKALEVLGQVATVLLAYLAPSPLKRFRRPREDSPHPSAGRPIQGESRDVEART